MDLFGGVVPKSLKQTLKPHTWEISDQETRSQH